MSHLLSKYWLTVLILPSSYLWFRLFQSWKRRSDEVKELELFYKRHNCVVMYSKTQMTGWFPHQELAIGALDINDILQPFLYFIDTANYDLDIAAVSISIQSVLRSIVKAARRGVKVRLLSNFVSIQNHPADYHHLIQNGVKVALFVSKENNLDSIMHCKFMVKDVRDNEGYLCTGSLNLSGMSSFLRNYEDVIFTSDLHAVRQVKNYFQDSWDQVNLDNQRIYNKLQLAQCRFGTQQ